MQTSHHQTQSTNSPTGGGGILLCVWPGSLDFKLGLSFVDNSHSKGDGITQHHRVWEAHGQSGSGDFQQRHGRNLTFGTLMTLPDFDNDQLLLIFQSWAWSGE